MSAVEAKGTDVNAQTAAEPRKTRKHYPRVSQDGVIVESQGDESPHPSTPYSVISVGPRVPGLFNTSIALHP